MSEAGREDSGQPAPQFELAIVARFHEADLLGRLNNAVYLHYLEQAAVEHAAALGLTFEVCRALGGVFVARRHEIEFLRPAFPGDVMLVQTWLGEARGARVARHYQIVRLAPDTPAPPFAGRVPTGALPDGELVVTAETDWVFMSEDGRPRRIPPQILTQFAQALVAPA
ncbi:MAG: thioesterase family protein [Thermomicrobiales bacterium]